MPPRIVPILSRLRQDLAATLSEQAIEAACRRAGHRWRDRLLGPATTIYLFLLQVLHGNTACSHVVHFGGRAFSDSAYCQARKRLPLDVFHRLLEATAETLRSATADGRDGSAIASGSPTARLIFDSCASVFDVRARHEINVANPHWLAIL